jgi:hypothetical protein
MRSQSSLADVGRIGIDAALNVRGILTARGERKWATQVQRVLARRPA